MDDYERYIEHHEHILEGDLEPQEREATILDALIAINASLYRKVGYDQTPGGWRTLLGIAVITVIILGGVAALISGGTTILGMCVLVVLLLAALFFTIRMSMTEGRRRIRRKYGDYLTSEVGPLYPTLEELQQALTTLKQHRVTIGKRISTKWLDKLLTSGANKLSPETVAAPERVESPAS